MGAMLTETGEAMTGRELVGLSMLLGAAGLIVGMALTAVGLLGAALILPQFAAQFVGDDGFTVVAGYVLFGGLVLCATGVLTAIGVNIVGRDRLFATPLAPRVRMVLAIIVFLGAGVLPAIVLMLVPGRDPARLWWCLFFGVLIAHQWSAAMPRRIQWLLARLGRAGRGA